MHVILFTHSQFDWFFLMIYWRTDAQITSPSTFFCIVITSNKWILQECFRDLFTNRSQTTSKYDKNISNTLICALCATFSFSPHFNLSSDQCPNSPCSNSPKSFINITRIKEMIANLRCFDCRTNSPYPDQKKHEETSMENIDTDVRV